MINTDHVPMRHVTGSLQLGRIEHDDLASTTVSWRSTAREQLQKSPTIEILQEQCLDTRITSLPSCRGRSVLYGRLSEARLRLQWCSPRVRRVPPHAQRCTAMAVDKLSTFGTGAH